MATPTGNTQRVVVFAFLLYKKWQTKSLESASTFRVPPDLLEIDSHEFAELAAMFRDDDCNTVAQAGPLDIVK